MTRVWHLACLAVTLLLLATVAAPVRAQFQVEAPPQRLAAVDFDSMLKQVAPASSSRPKDAAGGVMPAGFGEPSVDYSDADCPDDCPQPLWQPGAMYGSPVNGWFGTTSQEPTYFCDSGLRQWQLLPDGLIYKSYLAGVKEPRFAGVVAHDKNIGTFLDVALGGRVGIIRYGTQGNVFPQGWQLDIEGAAFPRVNLTERWDLDSADFRFGIPLTYGVGRFQAKFGGYHLSAHVGDEYLQRNPGFVRINYSRDVLVLGASYYPTDNVRLYAETGWAYLADGGSEPWEFQFGLDFSPAAPSGAFGAPFFAINAHLREEVDFGGEFVVQLGWQWRGCETMHLLRTGFQYFNGKSNQYEFYTQSEQQFGVGLWYDY